MQNLSVISANIWDILISLVNLLLLTLIVKKFLFKPVMKMIGQRRAAIDADYEQAKAAREEAEESRRNYAEAMAAVKETGDQIIADATRAAENRSAIVAEAREKAADLRRQAEADVVLTRKKAEEDMKREIADVSTQLTGMLLKREINEEDHRNLIDSFLQEIGTDDDDNNK